MAVGWGKTLLALGLWLFARFSTESGEVGRLQRTEILSYGDAMTSQPC